MAIGDRKRKCDNVCSAIFLAVIVVLLILDIAKWIVALSVMDDKDCPSAYNICIYLMLSAKAPVLLYKMLKNSPCVIVMALVVFLFVLFYFIMLIVGSVMIYPIKIDKDLPECSNSQDPPTKCKHKECDDLFFWFAKAMVTSDWIYAVLTLIYAIYGCIES